MASLCQLLRSQLLRSTLPVYYAPEKCPARLAGNLNDPPLYPHAFPRTRYSTDGPGGAGCSYE